MYALKIKGQLEFICTGKTVQILDRKITKCYNNWRGMQPRGSDPTKEDYMVDKDRVKLLIKRLD